jgi:PBP superfamily domain
MNDDFLHRIRVEPPPDFLRKLKSRLDLQPPPTTPAPVASTFKRTLLALLLTGSVFAITLMLLNRHEPQGPPVVASASDPHEAIIKPAAPADKTPKPTTKTPDAKPATDDRSIKLTGPTFISVTTTALQSFVSSQMTKGSNQTLHIADSATEAIGEFCGTSPTTKGDANMPFMAIIASRMTRAELDVCARRPGSVVERFLGDQAIVLARSKLYAPFSLTPTDLFLALAQEIPDPNQPGKLIPNPNTMWNEVNSALEREPIEFYGPGASSPVGIAFREMVFDVGCRAQPGMTTVEKCPGLRTDGVYTEATPIPTDMLLKLQTNPDAIGILAYGETFLHASELTASPIRGVVPTKETIGNGSYPASRPVYIYSEQANWLAERYFVPAIQRAIAAERFAIIPPERSQP